jgi:coenzyme F420-reducing hydrogenase beta subunit
MRASPVLAINPGSTSVERSPDLLAPRDIVRSGLCIGCGACAARSEAEMRWDRYGFLKPAGDRDWYRRPEEDFSRTCPFSTSAADEDTIAGERFPLAARNDRRIGRFERAYVGAVAEGEWRARGSSGGMVSWVASELLRTRTVDAVIHVKPSDSRTTGRLFAYGVSRSLDEIANGAKSRYYPIDLSHVLREVRQIDGRYAIVGVPCFIKAVHLLRRADPLLAQRITHTLGLFCGHMKSARLVQSFAWQLGAELSEVRTVDYRVKNAGRPANWYRTRLELADGSAAEQDWWQLADGDWGAGFFQNSACDICDDVVAETADIAFGDAWVEPYSSDGRGTNVVVVRSKALCDLLEAATAEGRLDLKPVDADFIAETQAAGLRHRRQGLAYRLSWMRRSIRPRKRVRPERGQLSLRRRVIFRTRAAISRWSHRMMWLARTMQTPGIYLGWARVWLRLYQGAAWSNGRWGKLFDSLLPR